jgi:hypothetical protein
VSATFRVFDDRSEVPSSKSSERLQVASALQASGFRSDVTLFRLNARPRKKTGSLSAFRWNTAERVYIIEAAHNPEVAGSNPAPATEKAPETGPFARKGLRILGRRRHLRRSVPPTTSGRSTWAESQPRNNAANVRGNDRIRTRDLRRDLIGDSPAGRVP